MDGRDGTAPENARRITSYQPSLDSSVPGRPSKHGHRELASERCFQKHRRLT